MTQSEEIAKQVALKAAIELAKDKFKIDNIKPVVPFEEPPSVIEIEPANEQKVTYKYGNDTNTGEDTATDGQKKYVKDLFAKLPSDEKQKYDKQVNAKTMSWQFAQEHIPLFQEILKKEQNTAPF